MLRKQFTASSRVLQACWVHFQNTGPDAILCLLQHGSLTVHSQARGVRGRSAAWHKGCGVESCMACCGSCCWLHAGMHAHGSIYPALLNPALPPSLPITMLRPASANCAP